jgi:hypothetical protein
MYPQLNDTQKAANNSVKDYFEKGKTYFFDPPIEAVTLSDGGPTKKNPLYVKKARYLGMTPFSHHVFIAEGMFANRIRRHHFSAVFHYKQVPPRII